MPGQLNETLLQDLDALAAEVGFQREIAPEAGVPVPPGLQFWASPFALIGAVPVANADAVSLDGAFVGASDWMSLALKAAEKQGRLLDGYLLLALPSIPRADLLRDVRRLETNTSVCRKHVLWPDDKLSWIKTLAAVTTLGLPAALASNGAVAEPELPISARRALEDRENGASFDDVAMMVEELSTTEPEGNKHVD